jgi:hypothetical protein
MKQVFRTDELRYGPEDIARYETFVNISVFRESDNVVLPSDRVYKSCCFNHEIVGWLHVEYDT